MCCTCSGRLTAEGMKDMLPFLQRLANLSLADCHARGALKDIRKLKQLTSLDLASISLAHTAGPPQMSYLSAMKSLKRLALPNVDGDTSWLHRLKSLRKLQELNLAGCANASLNNVAIGPLLENLTCLTALQISLQENILFASSIELLGLNMRWLSASLGAAAALPLEALRLWEAEFPCRRAFMQSTQVAADVLNKLEGIFEAHQSSFDGINYALSMLKRAMLQATALFQEHDPHCGSFLVPLIQLP